MTNIERLRELLGIINGQPIHGNLESPSERSDREFAFESERQKARLELYLWCDDGLPALLDEVEEDAKALRELKAMLSDIVYAGENADMVAALNTAAQWLESDRVKRDAAWRDAQRGEGEGQDG